MRCLQESLNQGTTYFLKVGDLTLESTDAIVNAANSSLLGGGGVDGAIHRRGGPAILEECRILRQQSGRCATGDSVITTGGRLAAKYVIHTVGPVWGGGNNEEAGLLSRCIKNSIRLASQYSIKSIAFPAISTGAYRFPLELAAETSQKTLLETVVKNPFLERVGFVLFDDKTFDAFLRAFSKLKSDKIF